MSSSGRASRARSLTLSLAALCLLAQLSGLAHMAFVPHVTCAEHGELVEAAAPAIPWSVVSSPEALQVWADEPTLEATPGHSHDHCFVSSMRRTPAYPPCPASLVIAAPFSQPAGLSGEPRLVATLPLLSVAPKSSPPRA